MRKNHSKIVCIKLVHLPYLYIRCTVTLVLLIQNFLLSSNLYELANTVQWLGYMLQDLGFKSCHKQENYLFSTTSTPAPAPTQPQCNAECLATHIHLEPSLKISGAIPTLNLSPSMAHIGTTLYYLNLLPMYTLSNKKIHWPKIF